jgi:PAS domain S-box-containing protein
MVELPLKDADKSPVSSVSGEGDLLRIAFEAMDSAPSGWVLAGKEGRILWANPSFLDMFGFADTSAVTGLQLAELFASDRMLKVEDISQFIEKCRKDNAEFEVVGAGDRAFCVTVSMSEVQNHAGQIVGRMFFFLNISGRKQIETELRHSQQYLRSLSAKLVDAQESERKRVARELHDSVGASLSALKFAVEQQFDYRARGLKDSCPSPDKIVESIQQIIEDVRRISHNLHPSILDDLGLKTAVRSFCRQSQKSYPELRIDTEIDLNPEGLSERLELVIYRVVQECVTNAARHGAATQIGLRLEEKDDEISLSIEDDGCGFDVDAVCGEDGSCSGMGLENIRERTEIFGGRFWIDSTVGAGTLVRCRWPILRQ